MKKQSSLFCVLAVSKTALRARVSIGFADILFPLASSGLMVEEIEPRQPCGSMGMVMAQTVQADVKLFQVLLQAE